ncbi:putative small nucleolar ribonucleoprotein complex subunit protein [Eutypa lata UCREL1]|uniref:U three protein 7 n=1 Tax=Eutypa lata (strain UCR-EL1) TaxID=1287681 RepID=M7SEB3_EUTLA|nr:putative small nucleolar ribonucleoprotein complex subunit protein [Eutypa lata UCREL1]
MEVDTEVTNGRDNARDADHDNGALAIKSARTELIPKHERIKRRRMKDAQREYGRGSKIDTKGIKDKKLRRNLSSLEHKYKSATIRAKDAEVLLENTAGFLEPEHELEKTYKIAQDDIEDSVAVETAKKRFEFNLSDKLGPYIADYSRNGRDLLLAGRKGHVAAMDWRQGKLGCELQLGETVRDVRWLHSDQFFAVSQKKYVYIYDRQGVELHVLKKHQEVSHMEFLPYHYLLATLGMSGYLKYQDVSTGQLVSEIPTRLGPAVSLTQNPYNAVLHCGHQNGTITLWSPTSQAISDRNLTAVGWGTQTTIWKDLFVKHRDEQEKVQSPYMNWGGDGKRVERVRWCPYEDLLGVSHDEGFSSIIVPGAGEPNFDALEVNPFETTKQRQETEVKSLLNKLKPEMIALDPNFIGNLDLRSEKQRKAEKDLDAKPADIETEIRNKARGKNSALSKYLRKQRKRNVVDEKKLKAEEIWKERQEKTDKRHEEKQANLGPALGRFARKE